MPESQQTEAVILMADDDEADVYTARRAFRQGGVSGEFHAVADGEELLDFLCGRGAYTAATAPRRYTQASSDSRTTPISFSACTRHGCRRARRC